MTLEPYENIACAQDKIFEFLEKTRKTLALEKDS